MTGNGIESDFVLPDSLFISDYSTLPAFYPHFGANCRFFCTISMSPDSSTLFCSPNAARGAASGLRQRVFDPLDSRSRDSVERIFTLCPRADWGETQGALPLDSAKGSSTLWTPVRAIQLSAFSCCARVLIGGTQGALPISKKKFIFSATFCILPHLTGGKEGKRSDADGIHPARADDAGQALPRLLHTAALRG